MDKMDKILLLKKNKKERELRPRRVYDAATKHKTRITEIHPVHLVHLVLLSVCNGFGST